MENVSIDESRGSLDEHHPPHKDLSLKDGEKIHVNVKLSKKSSTSTSTASSKPHSSGGGLLPPPPPPGSIVTSPIDAPNPVVSSEILANAAATTGEMNEKDDLDWGDFTSS